MICLKLFQTFLETIINLFACVISSQFYKLIDDIYCFSLKIDKKVAIN